MWSEMIIYKNKLIVDVYDCMKPHNMYMKYDDDDDGGIQKTGQEEMRKVERK